MTGLLKILEQYFFLRQINFLKIDGSMPVGARDSMVNMFNSPHSEYFVFLLSTRAGLGLNLQTADTVIIYDSD